MDSEEIEKWDTESERAWNNDTHDVEFPEPVVALLKTVLQPEADVLDAGCGIGKHAKAFSKLGYLPTGIDQSAKAIEYARKLNPRRPFFNIRIQDIPNIFYKGGMYGLGFDLIHTSAVLQHSKHEHKKRILHIFYELLKPKGYLLCTECTFTSETFKILQSRNLSLEHTVFTDDWTDGYSFSEKGWIQFMAENGFQHIKTIPPWPYYLFQKRDPEYQNILKV